MTSGVDEPKLEPKRENAPRRGPTKRLVAELVLGVVLVVFAALNGQDVKIDWLFITTTTPLVVAIVGAGVLGFALGWLFSRRSARRAGWPTKP